MKTDMHSKLLYLTWTLLCLSSCLSCNKEPQYPMKTVAISYDESYDLARLYPELETSPFIKYDVNKGYYLISEEKQWSLSYIDVPTEFQTLTWDSVPLPSFLCGDNTGVTLTNPGVFIENQNDFPVYTSVDAILSKDHSVTKAFLYVKCYPLFKSIFLKYQTDCEQCIEFIKIKAKIIYLLEYLKLFIQLLFLLLLNHY